VYELHDLCKLFPRLGGAEFDALCQDIKANGLREPIVLHEGKILDGGNRYRACIEAGVDPLFVDFDGGNVVSFVLSANLHRRHLTAGQQAAIVATAQDWAKAHAAGSNQHKARTLDGPVTLPDRLATVAGRASASGASERTQRMADSVAKRDPELARQVAHGEVSLPRAAERVGVRKPRTSKANAKPPSPNPALDHPDAGADGDDAALNLPKALELIQELETELQQAHQREQGLEAALAADNAKAELLTLQKCLAHAERRRDEEMRKAKDLTGVRDFYKKQLARCGKAVGEPDLKKVVAAVEALARAASQKGAP